MKLIKIGVAVLLYCVLQLLLMSCLNDYAFGQLAGGTYTVGNSGTEDYTSLTNAGGLFQDINASGLSGNIIVTINTDLPAEIGTYSLNQWSGVYSVTIQPQNASVRTITYSGSCGAPLINVNGADNFIIDGSFGGSGRYLEFISSCSDRPVVRYTGDCLDNVLTNCILRSDNNDYSSTSGGIVNVSSTQIDGSDNLLIANCLLTDYSGAPDVFFAVQASEPSDGDLENLVITGNEFYNINGKGIHIREQTGAGMVVATEVSRNHFYNDQTITGPGSGWVMVAMEFESGMGHVIRGNYIGGQTVFCGGGSAQMDLSGNQTVQVALIRILSSVQTPALVNSQDIIQIDSNVFRNINIETGTSVSNNISFIRTDGGHCNIGSLYPNYIGDASSDATLSPSVTFANNYNYTGTSEQNAVRLVYNESPGTVNIENNQVGSLTFKSNVSTGKLSVNLLYSRTDAATSKVTLKSNQVGGVSNNIYKGCTDYFRALYSNDEDGEILIRDNQFSGITVDGDQSAGCWIIRCWNGTATTSVINNTISDIDIGSGTQNSYLETIALNRPLSSVDSNTVSDVVVNSAYDGTQFTGILVNRSSSAIGVSYNRITDIFVNSTNVVDPASLYGISLSGSSSYALRCNFIAGFYNVNTNTSTSVRGINNTATGTSNFINNVILLDNGTNSNNLVMYGIVDNSGSGTNNYSHNTIALRGSNAGGSQRSSCFASLSTGVTRNIRNNIFSNQRTGGSGGHYVMYFTGTGGTLVSNYNLLYVEENTGKVVRYSTNRSFATWQGLGFDVNGTTGLVAQDLVDFTNGHQLTTLGNDIAGSSVGVWYDHIFTGRPIGLGYDMGAFELETTDLGSPLPVELTLFEATCDKEKTILHWITKSEIQNDYFILETSPDGINWSKISEIDGAGNANGQQDYYVEYETQRPGIHYYRLSQVDFNGEYETFDLISATCTGFECSEFSYLVSENDLSLWFKNDCLRSDAMLCIVDSRGRLVRSDLLRNAEGVNTVSVEGLSGFYIIRIINGTSVYSIKLVL